MFEVIFYKDKNGYSDVIEYLDELKEESDSNKNARINRTKIMSYISALSEYGTRIGMPYVRHIENDLWELRPLKNRIFFFYWKEDKFILLNYYIKKSQKTPKKIIEIAKSRIKDFLERND